MNHVLTVLFKGITLPFYRSHTGLLIVVFLIMFGTVESNQLINYHLTLIEGMFTSPIFMLCVFFIWTLYSLKILQFLLSLIRQSDYLFLNNLMLLSKKNAFLQLLLISVVAYLPVLIYTVFIYLIGISHHYPTATAGILLFQTALCFINAGVILTFLRTQHVFSWSLNQFRISNIGGRIGFYVSHFLSEEKIALLISKTFSLTLLYVVRNTTEPGDDFRIVGLTWIFVLLAHAFLILKLRVFEDRYLLWIRNLPISAVRTVSLYFIFYTALMIPELILSVSMVENAYEFALLWFLSGVMLMAVHAHLLKPNRDPDQFSVYLFWLLIVSFVIVLSKLTLLFILALGAAASTRIAKRYYEYEPNQF